MSKTKLLLDVVDDMRRLADSLQNVVDSLQENTPEPAESQTTHETQPAIQPTEQQISIEQVRAVLAEKSGQGKTQAVKALLYKYDAGKLSGVKPEDYVALMEEASKL